MGSNPHEVKHLLKLDFVAPHLGVSIATTMRRNLEAIWYCALRDFLGFSFPSFVLSVFIIILLILLPSLLPASFHDTFPYTGGMQDERGNLPCQQCYLQALKPELQGTHRLTRGCITAQGHPSTYFQIHGTFWHSLHTVIRQRASNPLSCRPLSNYGICVGQSDLACLA